MKTLSLRRIRIKKRYLRKTTYFLGHFLIYLGLVIVAGITIWLGVKVQRIYSVYRGLTPQLASLQALTRTTAANPAELDLAQIEDSLQSTNRRLAFLSEETAPFRPLTPYLGWVPIIGGDVEAAPHLLAAGQDMSTAGLLLFERFSPLLEAQQLDGGEADPFTLVVSTLAEARPDLARAEAHLRRAQASLDLVDETRLSPRLAPQFAAVERYVPLATSGLAFVQRLPTLLGAESPRTYLILTQNDDELRPTGGYINAAGHIILDQGRIAEFNIQDSYDVDRISEDYPFPPQPLYQYLAGDYWVLRDANWSPDFPTAARQAIEFYAMGQGVTANGVIALDQQGLAQLLTAIEPINVDGNLVTSKNLIRLMRQQWAPQSELNLNRRWWQQRKSFMLDLAVTARQKVEQNPGAINLPVLADSLRQALGEKHILIYLEDSTATTFLAEQNWTGALQPVLGDYLMVVDANLGFNKASASVERRLTYQLVLASDGSAQAQAKVVYQHQAQKRSPGCWHQPRYDPVYEDNMARCYWNYARLIVPGEARLVSGPRQVVDGHFLLRGESTSGEIDVEPQGSDKHSWGQLFLLPPEETLALDYVYTLPPGTARLVDNHWEYNLYLQKQPGTLKPPVEVSVTLPPGARVIGSDPLAQSQQGAILTYAVELKSDREIKISYIMP
jgi:hypothetical protein